jgi:hypothetical protein
MNVISEDYRAQQSQLHSMPRGYGGVNTVVAAPVVLEVAQQIGAQSVLDYGAGKGHLGEYLFTHGFVGDYRPYDPAIPIWAEAPQPSELVACCDVLEHIEPECLEAVLQDLRRVTLKKGIFLVNLREAKKTLPDGRNAHLIVKPAEWWRERLAEHFAIRDEENVFGKKDGMPLGMLFHVEPLP